MQTLRFFVTAYLLIAVPAVGHAAGMSRTYRASEDPKFAPEAASTYEGCKINDISAETTMMAACGLHGHPPDASMLSFDVTCPEGADLNVPASSFTHSTFHCIGGGPLKMQSADYWGDTPPPALPDDVPPTPALHAIKAAPFAAPTNQTEGRVLQELQWRVEQRQSARGARKATALEQEAMHLAALALRLADTAFAQGKLFQAQAPLHAAFLLVEAVAPQAGDNPVLKNDLLTRVDAIVHSGATLQNVEPIVCPPTLGCAPSTAAALPTVLQSMRRTSPFDQAWARKTLGS